MRAGCPLDRTGSKPIVFGKGSAFAKTLGGAMRVLAHKEVLYDAVVRR
jgi:hypothetical protein